MNKQRDGPTLFPLLEQCFLKVGLTNWKNFVLCRCSVMKRARHRRTSWNASETTLRHLHTSQTLMPRWFTGFVQRGNRQSCCWMITCAVEYSFQLSQVWAPSNHDGTPGQARKDEADYFLHAKEASAKVCGDTQGSPRWSCSSCLLFEQCQNADRASSILHQLKKDQKEKASKKLGAATKIIHANGIVDTTMTPYWISSSFI